MENYANDLILAIKSWTHTVSLLLLSITSLYKTYPSYLPHLIKFESLYNLTFCNFQKYWIKLAQDIMNSYEQGNMK